MADELYKIEGHGKVPEQARTEAIKVYDKVCETLAQRKLMSEPPQIERTDYKAIYELPSSEKAETARVSQFTLDSSVSWREITERAKKIAGKDLPKYAVTYMLEQYLRLTKEQKEALSKPRPTACRERARSSLDDLQGIR